MQAVKAAAFVREQVAVQTQKRQQEPPPAPAAEPGPQQRQQLHEAPAQNAQAATAVRQRSGSIGAAPDRHNAPDSGQNAGDSVAAAGWLRGDLRRSSGGGSGGGGGAGTEGGWVRDCRDNEASAEGTAQHEHGAFPATLLPGYISRPSATPPATPPRQVSLMRWELRQETCRIDRHASSAS